MSCKSLYVTRKKGKQRKMKCMMSEKPNACSSIEISKILGIDLTMRCIDSKRSNDMMYMEPNENLHL